MRPFVIAHRAAAGGARENSLAGIRAAAEVGADAVEFDVRRALNGELLLNHDRTLWRLAGVPFPLRLIPGRIARSLPLSGGGLLATFAEALASLAPGLVAAVDIKESGAAARVLREVREADAESQVMLWTRDVPVARRLAVAAPSIEVALLRDALSPGDLERFLDDAQRSGARAISAHWDAVTPQFVEEAHGRGLRVYAMARAKESQRSGLEAGLDGIVTRWPEEAREIVGTLVGHTDPQ